MSKSLIDKELLEKLQKHFRKANDVYLTCMDRDGVILTENHASNEEEQYMRQFFTESDMNRLLDSARMSQVETIVEESLETPYVKLCGVINRVNDSITMIWVVVAIIEELVPEEVEIPDYVAHTTDNRFYRSVAFLEALSRHVLMIKEQELQAKDVLEKAMESDARLKEQLCRSEGMASVVRQIESDDNFMEIAEKSIREVCEVLHVQGGCIVRLQAETNKTEVICEYTTEENWTLAQKIKGKSIKELPFFDGKSYMLSSDSMMPGELEKFFIKHHLSAAIFMPMELNGACEMYLCFYEFDKNRVWNLEDVKFINDVKRILHGIVERRMAHTSLTGSFASLELILENAGCGIYVLDYAKKEVLYTNKAFMQMIAKDIDKAILQTYFFSMEKPETEFPFREVEFKKYKKWFDVSQVQFAWIDGRQVSLGTVYDISDKKMYQQKIEQQISNDQLTGLYNRMRCEQDLNRYIKEAEENGSEGAYMLIDMDDFRNINEGLGYQQGDRLLKSIAHNLVRVSGIENNCYRVTGDRFAVIVQGDTYKELSRICKELREFFNRPWFLKNEDYYCTMSMGVVCFPADGNNVDSLNRKAEIALSTAKKKGKNCVEFYNEKVEGTSFYRLDMEQNMRRATLNSCNEFEVYYQPIMKVGSDKNVCCGAEALVRWNSAELGFIPPNNFIALAEYLGLINPIGEHVLYEAAKRCKYWNDCGYPEYEISVNVSAIQLLQPDFVEKVKTILDKTRIQPKNVILEVTERLAINDMNRMKTVLGKLKKLGVRIALDDFGKGYSSLNHIRQLPIDVIKIDRCYVENLCEDDFAESFVKTVSQLAKTVGIKVCVEGVEQRKQLEVLSKMNVGMIQGYYYGKPMPIKEFELAYLK